MGACEACHASKVKCQFDGKPLPRGEDPTHQQQLRPCDRCARLQVECVPHVSRQGKHSKRKRSSLSSSAQQQRLDGSTFSSIGSNNNALSVLSAAATATASSSTSAAAISTVNMTVEKQFVTGVSTSQLAQHGPLHYGMNHIIRQWMVLAFSRSSFRLLEIASRLANRVQIPMEQILYGANLPQEWFDDKNGGALRTLKLQRMGVQDSEGDDITSSSSSSQQARPCGKLDLKLWEIPKEVPQAMRCMNKNPATCGGNKERCEMDPNRRYIFIRETHQNQVRFFVSKLFARDICDLSTIQQTWTSNHHEVKYLWLVDTKDKAYGKSFLQFIRQYTTPDTKVTEPIRIIGKTIRLKNSQQIKADLIMYYLIKDLDHSYMVNDFILPADFVSPFEQTDAKTPTASPNKKTDENESFRDLFDDFPAFEGISVEDDADWSWLEDLLMEEAVVESKR